MNVLFVCTGNICRSPTAERLAAAYSTRYQLDDFNVTSAGTQAVIGHAIHPAAAHVLEELGGSASHFVARQLTAKITAEADLVLTMTKKHRDAVLELAPQLLNRTFTLSEASRLASEFDADAVADLAALRPRLSANTNVDIADPIGRSHKVFATVGNQIAGLLPPILDLCRRS